VELLMTMPVMVEDECYCCAALNVVNSTVYATQSARAFCRDYPTLKAGCAASAVTSKEDCEAVVTALFMQRLRIPAGAILLPVQLNGESAVFFAR
jgi:hypothetical protein